MIRIIFICLLITGQLYAQSLIDDKPALDLNFLNSKQAKRQADLKGNRNAAGHINMDWARWQAWLELAETDNGIDQAEPWMNLGPDTVSGRIIGLAFHPTDPDEFLVGSASGGLWRTCDYGVNWECLTDNYPTMGVGAVAYNPQNPSSILIATGEGYGFGGEFTSGFGILISYDSGLSWQTTGLTAELSQNFAGMDLLWHPTDTSIVNVASSYGVYRSTDGGLSWHQTLERLPSRMKADPQDPNRIYLSAQYYNTNFQGGFFISSDAGQNWTQITGTGLPPDNEIGYTSLHIHLEHNNQIYMVIGQSPVFGSGPMRGLFKSSDYGVSFSEIPTVIDLMCYHPPYQHICQSWFANTIAVNPSDTTELFCGGTRFRKSIDGGLNWYTADLNPGATEYSLHPDHHQTQFHPITGDLIDCHDGGVGISKDGGITWENKSNGLITHQFYDIAVSETNPNTVIGGTQDVGAFTVKDVITGDWKNPVGGDAFGSAIDQTNENIWYITDLNYGRQKTFDAGESWTFINAGTTLSNQWRMPIVLHPDDPLTMYTAENNSIYKSVNGGNIWSYVSGFGPIQSFVFDAINPDLMYANRLWGNEIYRSFNRGTTWQTVSSPPGFPVTELATLPGNENVLLACVGSYGFNDQLYRSNNNGNSWYSLSSGLPSVPVHALVIDPFDPDVMYIGGDLGVWCTIDAGLSWFDFNEGLPMVVVEDLHYTSGDTALHIGTYGRGYWKTPALNPPPVSYIDIINPDEFEMGPNPANGRVTLRTSTGNALIRIFDAHGILKYETLSSDRETEFSTSGWSSGVYIVHVITNRNTLSQLLVITN